MPLNESPRGNPFNNRKFGIEIEVANVNQNDVADALSRAGIACAAEQYNHRTRPHWKITTDSSIQSDNGRACEIVSPILTPNRQTFEQISQICTIIKSIGGKVNSSCGFHVHVDCRGINDPDFWRLLLSFYSTEEDQIDSLMLPGRRGNDNRYCQSNKLRDGDNWTGLWRTDLDRENSRLQNFLGGQERYRKLNFASFVRHGTVEFRQFHGTLNSEEILNWVGFCLTLVQGVFDFVTLPGNKQKLQGNVVAETPAPPIVRNDIPKYFTAWYRARQEYYRTYHRIGGIEAQLVQGELVTSHEEAKTLFHQNLLSVESQTPEIFKMPSDIQNNLAKLLFFTIQHISLSAGIYAAEARSGLNPRSGALRDASFMYGSAEDRATQIKEVIALYYNFNGTTEQKNRMVRSKLRNLGVKLSRDGYLQMVDRNETYEMETAVNHLMADHGRGERFNEFQRSIIHSNRFLRVILSRNEDSGYLPGIGTYFANVLRTNRSDLDMSHFAGKLYGQRLLESRNVIQSLVSNTVRFWFRSPLELNERSRTRSGDMQSAIVSAIVSIKNQITFWQNDFYNTSPYIIDYYPRTALATELSVLGRTLRDEGPGVRLYNDFVRGFGASEANSFFGLLNNRDTTVYPTLPREPYLEAAKVIRGIGRVDEAWNKLSETRKKIETTPEIPTVQATGANVTTTGSVRITGTATASARMPSIQDMLRDQERRSNASANQRAQTALDEASRRMMNAHNRTSLRQQRLNQEQELERQRLQEVTIQLDEIFNPTTTVTVSELEFAEALSNAATALGNE